MNNKLKAEEILNYCLDYIGRNDSDNIPFRRGDKMYKEMLKEIEFMLEND